MTVAGLTEADVVYLRDFIHRASAIFLDESKDYLLETRLEKLARELSYQSLAALVSDLRRDVPGVGQHVVEALTTHETLFFRDVKPFETLKKEILPPLIAARQGSRQLTIWSAACSTGQEIFSIAMLLKEHFPDAFGWPIKLYATDISKQVIERAMQGRFQQLEINRGLPAAMLVKYFEKDGLDWRLTEELRRSVRFERLNLLHSWPANLRPDIVFMRNVLIYFNAQTKKEILSKLRQTLSRDGALMLGSAETTHGIDEGWERAPGSMAPWYRVIRSAP